MKAESSSSMYAYIFGLILFFTLPLHARAQDCRCDFTISLNGTEWFFDGDAKGVKPGDHICFASGDRGSIELRNIHGAPGNPVVLKNMCNGKTIFTSPGSRGNNIAVRNCSYLHMTGGNNPNEEYGLELVGAVMGLSLIDRTTDVEVDHFYIHDAGGVGIEANTKPTCDPATWRGNFEMNNLYLHHNWLDKIGGEGFYVGNSHYVNGVTKNCNGSDIVVYEHDMHNVEIAYNIVTNVQLDAIQVSAVLENLVVHHNYVYNFATVAKYGHQSGFQIGAGCHSIIYNNIADTGTGYCFFDTGRGNAQYYNNICINGQHGFLKTSNPPFINKPNYFANNIILNPRESGFHLYSNEGHHIINNILIHSQSNFQWIRLNSSNLQVFESNNIKTTDINSVGFVDVAEKDFHLRPGSPAIDKGKNIEKDLGININFDLDGNPRPESPSGLWDIGPYEYKPLGPTSDAGPDVNITLPTNTTILNGSGSSESGILGFTWTKKSGGPATLTNDNTSTLTVTDLTEGVYVFQLEVRDANGSAFDEVTVTVFPEGYNQSPTANAGNDITITLPVNAITLNGSGSDPDGTIASYSWAKINGPAATLTNEATPNLSVADMLEGVYDFELTVTDDDGASATDIIRVTVNPQAANQLPTVNAGADRTIYLPTDQVTLQATAGDADGTIVTILWEKRTGPAATLSNEGTLTLTADNLVLGTYIFRITVTDDRGGSRFDEVTVRVLQANQSPSANAGPNRTITLPTNTIVLNGQGTDPDGSITGYQWTKVSGPNASLVNAATANLTANNLSEGIYIFGLTVTDNNGATGYDEVRVTVNAAPVNSPPAVNAGTDRTITLPTNTLVLNGTASDSDGSISTIEWTKKNGPTATLSNANTLNLGLSNLVAGTYTFTLRVTDNNGSASSDDVLVTVLPNTVNESPIANAGANQFITLPNNSTTLTGIGSDPDGTISQVEWTKVTGPSVTLGGTNTNTLTLNNLVEGEYVFRFTVTDNLGAIGSDQVTVSVGASNVPPVVSAGPDQTISLPTNSTTLTANASDPDGSIQSYSWTQLSGVPATVSGQTTSTLSVSNLNPGIYEFEVTVTDNGGSSASDIVIVYVETTDNQIPHVSAGQDRTIYLPTNTVILEGSVTDNDGTISSVVWSKEGGPSVVLANENTPTLTALDLVEGVYTFRLTATDDEGGVAFAQVRVTVHSATTNQPPIANAGGNQLLKLPTNTITLNGVGIDPDGNIASYQWEKVSGPSGSLVTPNSSNLKLTDLVVGVYTFRLTVTDNNGATDSALATVTVLPASVNQNPLASAGQNQNITLPTNSTFLVGSGFDQDGTIQSYSWTKLSGPSGGLLTTPESQVTSITGLAEGVYAYRLIVTDDMGATGFDEVTVTVSSGIGNSTPSANAGGNKSIFLPTNSLNLFGSGSDQDGTITNYTWKKISGGTVTLTNQNTPTLTLSNLQEGQYIFQLVVTDNNGATGEDFATIIVNGQTSNIPPIVFAGGDKIIKLPQTSITLVGTASDSDGQITSYTWSQKKGTPAQMSPTNSALTNISSLIEGTYQFRLTVEDNSSASSFDEMTLQVISTSANLAPIVDAGKDVSVYLPENTHMLSGNASDDGAISTYLWTKVSGPSVSIISPENSSTSIENLQEGVYIFRLTVIDNNNTSSSDDITVTVFPPGVNKLPVVDAGTDHEITLPTTSLTLIASASDPDGTLSSTLWTKISGGAATMAGEATLSLDLSNLEVGTYLFRFTATDDQGATASDDVRVIVRPVPPNQKPLVDAGISIVVTLPTNEAVLNGSASDPDGSITSVIWTQQSGPNTAALTNAGTLSLTASNLIAGTYIFRLSATDNEGASSFSNAIVLVINETTDLLAPVAYAGDDITLTLPDNEVTVIGDGLDPDGFIENYLWEQIGGLPANFTFSENILTVTNLQPGNYAFRLTVVDTDALTGFDEMNISVIEETDEIPVFFSPNNDGPGDLWQFRNIDSYEQCSLVVFNRAGLEVFAARPYQNNWDGSYNGKPLKDGDYYYIISCDDGRQLKGAVRIIR